MPPIRAGHPQLRTPPARKPASPGADASRFNATKHGLRSARLLLAGDESAEFEARRRDAYAVHHPRTAAEARCVDTLVRLEWRIERCERWQEIYDAKHDEVVGEDGGTGPHCEADPHRWMHRAMDCVRQAQRMEWQMTRALRRLELLQKLRRQNLMARMAALEELEEEALEPPEENISVEAADGAPEEGGENGSEAEAGQAVQNPTASTGSEDGGNGNCDKRNHAAPPMTSPGFHVILPACQPPTASP